MTKPQWPMDWSRGRFLVIGHRELVIMIPLVYAVGLALYNHASASFYGVTDHADWP